MAKVKVLDEDDIASIIEKAADRYQDSDNYYESGIDKTIREMIVSALRQVASEFRSTEEDY